MAKKSKSIKKAAKTPGKKNVVSGKKVSPVKSVTKKSAAKKSVTKKPAVKKSPAKKTASRKPVVKKAALKTSSKRPVAKKAAAKKSTVKKAAPKKAGSKKPVAKKAANRKSTSINEPRSKPVVPVVEPQQQGDAMPGENPTNANESARITNASDGLHEKEVEDPARAFNRNEFEKATARVDPRSKIQLNNVSKSGVRPSGKKPLWKK